MKINVLFSNRMLRSQYIILRSKCLKKDFSKQNFIIIVNTCLCDNLWYRYFSIYKQEYPERLMSSIVM